MNKKLFLVASLLVTPISSFASVHGMASQACQAKGGSYIRYSHESIDIDAVRTVDNNLEYYLYIKDPSPVPEGIVYLGKENKIFKDFIFNAKAMNKSISLCLTSNADILSASINNTEI